MRAQETLDDAVLVRFVSCFLKTIINCNEISQQFLAVSHAHGVPCVDEFGEVKGQFGWADLAKRIVDRAEKASNDDIAKWTRRDILTGVVKDVLGADGSGTEPVVVVKPGTNLLAAAREMVAKKAHRCFVVDGAALTGVVSQSMIIDAVEKASHDPRLADDKTLSRTHKIQDRRPVFAVNAGSTMLEALRYMVGEKVTGVAVMRGTHLVGTVSVSDIHLVTENGGKMLLATCEQIIAEERRLHVAPAHAVTVSHEHSLIDLIKVFKHHHVSRAWIVEKDGSPSRTVTFSDVLEALVN